MALIGYARVSTRGQKDDSQHDDLTAAGCEKIFTDKASGKLASRPKLDECLAYLRAGDVLVITRMSRAMRSIRHMIDLNAELDDRSIGLKVLKQAIDTTTPAGRLVFHFTAAIDEFQRELIVEGTLEGLAAARARGHHGGRPPAMTPEQDRAARQLLDSGECDVQALTRLFGVSRATIYRHLSKPA